MDSTATNTVSIYSNFSLLFTYFLIYSINSVYVSLPRDSTDRSASIVFETNSVGDYRWHVRITQIDCNYANKKRILSNRYKRYITYGPNGPILPFQNLPHPPYSLPAPMGCLQVSGKMSKLLSNDFIELVFHSIDGNRREFQFRGIPQ